MVTLLVLFAVFAVITIVIVVLYSRKRNREEQLNQQKIMLNRHTPSNDVGYYSRDGKLVSTNETIIETDDATDVVFEEIYIPTNISDTDTDMNLPNAVNFGGGDSGGAGAGGVYEALESSTESHSPPSIVEANPEPTNTYSDYSSSSSDSGYSSSDSSDYSSSSSDSSSSSSDW